MKSQLLSRKAPLTGAATTLQVRAGDRIRLLGFTVQISGNSLGEVVTLAFAQGNETKVFVLSGPVDFTPAVVSFALGSEKSQPHLSDTTVATGVANYVDETNATGPLPDIWWQQDVQISIASESGLAATTALLLYEQVTA